MRRLLGAAFGGIAALRAEAYGRGLLRRQRLAGPVVSVGNLGVGGSGKTPVVARIAEMLMEAGEAVSVLSRGYGGSFAGDALVVSDGARVFATASVAGDEPVMLARALPGAVVAIGPRRDVVGRVVGAHFGRRVHVLDDGFQHLRLERDLDLGVPRRARPRGPALPAAGCARAEALARADCILLTRLEAATEPELAAIERGSDPRDLPRRARPSEWLRSTGPRPGAGARVPARAGIARPGRFGATWSSPASRVVGRAFFRDHHRFRPASSRPRPRGRGRRPALVTTAKDAVRLERLPSPECPSWCCTSGAHRRRAAARAAAGRGAEGRVKRERRHALEAALASAVAAVVRRLPRRLVLALGRGSGPVWGALDARHLRVAADNLRQAFFPTGTRACAGPARAVYAHFGR